MGLGTEIALIKALGGALPAITAADNGKVLTADSGEWVAANPSGGGDVIVANIRYSYGQTTCDMTYAEIKSAIDQGKTVIGKCTNYGSGAPHVGVFKSGSGGWPSVSYVEAYLQNAFYPNTNYALAGAQVIEVTIKENEEIDASLNAVLAFCNTPTAAGTYTMKLVRADGQTKIVWTEEP